MLEGVLIGMISGGLAYLIEWYIYIYLQKMVLSDTIQMIHIVGFNSISSWLALGFLATGCVDRRGRQPYLDAQVFKGISGEVLLCG